MAVLVEHLGALVAAHELAAVHAHGTPVLVGVPRAAPAAPRTAHRPHTLRALACGGTLYISKLALTLVHLYGIARTVTL